MEKIYKKLCMFLSCLLVVALVAMMIAVPVYKTAGIKLDFFSANQIADNIKNLELNMTSVIYVQNTNGDWVEYQRLHGNENRIWVGIDKMPENLQDAFVAIEDERFETHAGVDWRRTIKAVSNFLVNDSTSFGGSTITQQLIKNVTSDNDKSAMRKVREIVRALLIETKLEKSEILEAYLNTIALGNGICGVKVAANYYFNKEVEELTLVECAALAAITKSPTKYNPISGAEENKTRRNTVLAKMLELGKITQEEYDEAYDADIVIDNSQKQDYEAEVNSWFVDALIEQAIGDLSEKYNCSESMASTMLYNGGYKIYATMSSSVQDAIDKAYIDTSKYFSETSQNDKGQTENVQSAITIMDYEGHILGMAGGTGEKTVNRGLNRAYNVPRQPGSTMKPLGVYALAIENDYVNYTSTVVDKAIKNYYPDGSQGPKEWYGYYKGNVKLNYAIRKSMNAVPVRLLKEKVGVDNSYDFLKNKLQLTYLNENDKNLSALALGGCTYGVTPTQSVAAYAIFGNQGVFYEPTTYYRIERTNGEIEIEYKDNGEQVISPASATIMNHLLQEVVYGSEGTGRTISSFNSKMKAYAKTGTSSDTKDSWIVAGTPYYVGSVWYGYDNNLTVKNSNVAKQVWRDVMKELHQNLPKKEFEDSADVYKKGSGYYKSGTTAGKTTTSSSSSSTSSAASSTESTASTPSVTTPTTPPETSSSSSSTSSSQTSSNESTTSSNTSSSGSSSGGEGSDENTDSSSSSSSSTSSDSDST